MKRKWWAIALGTLLCMGMLAGCGAQSEKSNLVGKWDLVKMEKDGISINQQALQAKNVEIQLTLTEDGKFVLKYDDSTVEGTYKENGKKLDLTSEGETLSADLENGQILMEERGIRCTFEKADGKAGSKATSSATAKPADPYAGTTWKFIRGEAEGETVSPEEADVQMTIVFEQDGKCKVSDQENEYDATYKVDGNTVRITDLSGTIELSLKDDELVLEQNDVLLFFAKEE